MWIDTQREFEVWSVSRIKDVDDWLEVILRDESENRTTIRMPAQLAPNIHSVVRLAWAE